MQRGPALGSAGLLLSKDSMRHAMHWRAMTTLDLPAVEAIAAAAHPAFPEDVAVFAERLQLYPDGSRFLELDGRPAGYLISHPWRFGTIPALNSRIGALPAAADTYYLHDLALLPAARGTGAAGMVAGDILRHASEGGWATASLVAVNGSTPFWKRQGYLVVDAPELEEKLGGYEAAARLMARVLD